MEEQSLMERAVAQHQAGQFAHAEIGYKTILLQDPSNIEAYQYLSHAQLSMGRADEALANLNKGFELAPNHFGILSTLGSYYLNNNDFNNALKYAQKAVDEHPKNADAYFNIAIMYIQMQRQQEAVPVLNKAVELNPNLSHAHYNLGCLYYGNQQLEQAVACFEKVLDIDPNFLAANINMGQACLDLQVYEKAIKYYEKALELDASRVDLYASLGMAYHALKKFDEAQPYFEKTLKHQPDNIDAKVLLANVYRDKGLNDQAQELYQQVVDQVPQHPIALVNLKQLKSKKINAWHFSMLADTARNEAFQTALEKVVKPESIVLDIGSGSGLLSLMAGRAGAKKVYACELVKELADISKKIVKDNEMEEKVTVFNKLSRDISVGTEIPEKADILVSEILATGLFGEGVIPSFRHAQEHLLKPNAVIIPQSANIHGVLIESPYLKRSNPVQDIMGFDLSAFDEFRAQGTYSVEDLNAIPHNKLSDLFPIYSVDFQELPEEIISTNPHYFTLDVTAQNDGIVQGIAFWFQLFVDEDITLSTGPDGQMIHWKQAVFMFDDQREVKSGDILQVGVYVTDDNIRFSL